MPVQRYVSSEVAHFVGKGLSKEGQYKTLLKILTEGMLTHPPHSANVNGNLMVNKSAKPSTNEMYSPQIICFCDIPLGDLDIHIKKYSPFGLSFSKNFVVKNGGCPVFYLPLDAQVKMLKRDLHGIDIETSGEGALYENIGKGEYFDKMIDEYIALFDKFKSILLNDSTYSEDPEDFSRLRAVGRFFDFHIFSYIKFYNHSYADENDDNFYLEREWRIVGNMQFDLSDIVTVFMPKLYAQRFRKDFPAYYSQLICIG